jgi:DNA polymerase I-like protein with 3'-5' exonuclease and polymerase domains
VAHDLVGGRQLRLWADELVPGKPPFRVDGGALFVSYFASAEMSAFLALDWSLPHHVLDLYVELRRLKNGIGHAGSLIDAARSFGFTLTTAEEKTSFRERILAGPPFTDEEKAAILRYCEADVILARELLRRLLPEITAEPKGFGQALLRGRYMQAVARMERTGVPVDIGLYTAIRSHWGPLKQRLIAEVDERYGVFLGETFKLDRFQALVDRLRLAWPRTPTGRLSVDEATFRTMARRYPELQELHELRFTLGKLRDFELPVGPDARNRCLLSPFGTKTARNAPSSTRFVFGPATWLRSLIRPGPDKALAYLDWSAEEIAIAAVLSGDKQLLKIVQEGDPYLGFARLAGLAPTDATKDTHGSVRELCKMLFLGVGYGMQEVTLASHLNCGIPEARQLLRLYREIFPRLTAWTEEQGDRAMIYGSISTAFGWRLRVNGTTKPTTLRNFPAQATGAEILRLACCLATERGIAVAAPVHDALLIESDAALLNDTVKATKAAMDEASSTVLGGLAVKVDVKVVRHPQRYSDKRGEALFARVYRLLEEVTGRAPAS